MIKKYTLHPFLFNLYIILFVYGLNIQEVDLSMIYRSLFISLLITSLLYALIRVFFKHNHKTGFFITIFLIGMFSYGFIYDKLEYVFYSGMWPFSSIHRYLILIYFIFYLALFFQIKKSNSSYVRVTYFMNVFVLVVILINFLSIGSKILLKPGSLTSLNVNPFSHSIKYPSVKIEKDSLPDVYCIILDGYGRQDILKEYFGFDNGPFINSLKRRGFYIADHSESNYPFTGLSLASSLNMNYLKKPGEFENIFNANQLIENNIVFQNFKNLGYHIVQLKSGYAVTSHFLVADKVISIGGPNEFERSLMSSTIMRLDDLVGFFTYRRLITQFRALEKVFSEPSPKFTFIHIVAPHPPYVLDENGNFKPQKKVSSTSWESKTGYIQQLKYVNKVIENFINRILSKSGTNRPIIIIQGDHGPWVESSIANDIYKSKKGILNAYLFPPGVSSTLYNSISPVNSFRKIFNLFHERYEMLPDVSPEFKELKAHPIFKNYLEEKE